MNCKGSSRCGSIDPADCGAAIKKWGEKARQTFPPPSHIYNSINVDHGRCTAMFRCNGCNHHSCHQQPMGVRVEDLEAAFNKLHVGEGNGPNCEKCGSIHFTNVSHPCAVLRNTHA